MSTRSTRIRASGRRVVGRFLAGRGASRPDPPENGLLGAIFGPLELRVLEALWRRDAEAGVRSLGADLPGTAYTTLMTTLDRLYKKGILDRRKDRRAYVYSPRYDRAELKAVLARDAVDDLLHEARGPGSAPVLAGFVEAVGRRDARMLDELERLVRRYRTGAGSTGPKGGTE